MDRPQLHWRNRGIQVGCSYCTFLLHQRQMTHLYTKQQMAVCVLHLPLSALELLGSLLLPLQPPDVVHRGFENGALIPAHVSGVSRRQEVYSQSQLTSWPKEHRTLYSPSEHLNRCVPAHKGMQSALTDRLTSVSRFPVLWCDRWCWISVSVQLEFVIHKR